MRVVLDANIYISSLISSKGNPAKIINLWLSGEFDVVASQPILDEILRVTAYPRLLKKFSKIKENRIEFVNLIAEQCIFVEPSERLNVVTDDESDNRYVEAAVSGKAQCIVSGDEHLLSVKQHKGISILSPSAFLLLLQNNKL